ncbi:hypothetical protein GSS88_04525 [Corynebacterium sp. 3HC-13]|uniref:endonuclease III domain-containing protein n=1 Tax=Corynebacterium poyangense TaxID=2684405 RepID=UPI001CCCD338|nr:hypothetical protein [Corynebacterium poyangense]MBZ8177064.1 hypothetical protein [Corynebacterium poyangense]
MCQFDTLALENALGKKFGIQGWWPAETTFEMMLGAVLVQNTRWENVEQSIARLRRSGLLKEPEILSEVDPGILFRLIRPSGFMRNKTAACLGLTTWLLENNLDPEHLASVSMGDEELRTQLLGIRGIGPETADVLMLFGFSRPVFVWSTYARRLLSKIMNPDIEKLSYEQCRRRFPVTLPPDISRAQELHALIVAAGKWAYRHGWEEIMTVYDDAEKSARC